MCPVLPQVQHALFSPFALFLLPFAPFLATAFLPRVLSLICILPPLPPWYKLETVNKENADTSVRHGLSAGPHFTASSFNSDH